MYKLEKIKIPENIYYLSDYPAIHGLLPNGKYIFNKVMTGCGATTLFLEDQIPTVLCSPRKELIRCKANSDRFAGTLHLFGSGNEDADVLTKINAMKWYVDSLRPTPYNTCRCPVPKILTTYDSSKHVIQGLQEMGLLDSFRFVIDEFQTLFTDAAFRGDVDIEVLENMRHLNEVVYLSATPYIENYLDQMEEFNTLPYLELEWPESSMVATDIRREKYYNGSPAQTIAQIIQKFRVRGFFEECMDEYGNVLRAKEAVFFVNDVKFIVDTITKNNLAPNEVNIICADKEENRTKLKKKGLVVGHAPRYGERHPTFTFCTKASFEGTDFYSFCAYTYIFSNITRENMAVDISLDLPQILGRQRRTDNPFRYSATLYYKTKLQFSEMEKQEFMNKVNNKCIETTDAVKDFEECSDQLRRNRMARKYRYSQKYERYENDYISVVDDKSTNQPKVVFNQLVMLNEIRAWEVQQNQYADGTYVMGAIDGAFRQNNPEAHTAYLNFVETFGGTFEARMKQYADFLLSHPECYDEALRSVSIPNNIKTYYNTLGYERLKALSWKEADIIAEMSRNEPDLLSSLSTNIRDAFPPGWYSLKDIKTTLQAIYDQLNLTCTAKATDIEQYLDCRPSKRTVNGVRLNGYEVGE